MMSFAGPEVNVHVFKFNDGTEGGHCVNLSGMEFNCRSADSISDACFYPGPRLVGPVAECGGDWSNGTMSELPIVETREHESWKLSIMDGNHEMSRVRVVDRRLRLGRASLRFRSEERRGG